MRISWGRIYPGQWTAFERAFQVAANRPVQGLVSRWLVRATDDPDAVFGVTLWKGRDDIEKWLNSVEYKHEFQARLSPHFVGSFSTSICEVCMSLDGAKDEGGREGRKP
jgi:heme-degrading monooxygenase HmoA